MFIADSKFIAENIQLLYDMYVTTYSGAGQQLWFSSPEDLLRYPCIFVVSQLDDKILAYIMFQRRRFANKISLGCHDGSREGKDEAIKIRVYLLRQRGWILEGAGATSWILRKSGVPIITNENTIERLLDIDPTRERIIINPNYDINDKTSSYYTHEFMNDGIVAFSNNETLFGIGGCRFDDDQSCTRKCESSL